MIRKNYIKIVFKKELLDTIRDKKTLLINIALPVIVWPLLTVFITQYSTIQTLRQNERVSKVVLIGDQISAFSSAILADDKIQSIKLKDQFNWELDLFEVQEESKNVDFCKYNIKLNDAFKGSFKTVESMIQDGQVDAIIVQQSKNIDKITATLNFRLMLLYDSTNPDSEQAANRINNMLETVANNLINERINKAQINESLLKPFSYSINNVADQTKTMSNIIGRILPLILIFLIVIGGFYPAITMTAGEKEHGTLPTVLCTPITHIELLFGKYLAINVITIIGVAMNVTSISAVIYFGMAAFPVNISPMILIYIFLSLIPISMLFSAMFMSVAMFANSFREGQNLLTPVTLLAVLPAYSALLPGMKLNLITAMIPGVNISLLIREILIVPVNPEIIFITLIANVGWTLGILVIAAQIFKAEQVLLSGRTNIGDIFTLDRNALPVPNAQLSIVLFIISLMGTFYISGALIQYGIIYLVPAIQLGLFTMIPLAISTYFKMETTKVFQLQRPPLLAVIGAIFIGFTLFVSTNWFSSFMSPPESYEKLLLDVLQLNDKSLNVIIVFILIAVIPGICEEFTFRGIILSGFINNLKPVWAIVITAVCFACAHFSIYNFLPLLVMGILLGFVAWRTHSIWTGSIIHIINNGLAVIFARFKPESTKLLEKLKLSPYFPMFITGAVLVTLTGILLIYFSASKRIDSVNET